MPAFLHQPRRGRARITVSPKEDRTYQGVVFASKAEMHRYQELRRMEQAGVIHNLERQVRYPLVVNGVKVCTYVADHRYEEGGETVIEDCKGCVTQVYVIKRKLMAAVHGIEIREVKAR